jgi:hypothetical protein
VSEREALYGGAMPESVALTLRRLAIERALVAHGILHVRRKTIPLPKRSFLRHEFRWATGCIGPEVLPMGDSPAGGFIRRPRNRNADN